MARRVRNADTAAKNWASGMQAAGQAYRDGIDAVQENPLDKAADATEAYLAGVQAGNAKRVMKLRAYGMEKWKQAAKDKGAPRLGTGATASQGRYQQVMVRVLQHQQQVLDTLPKRGTFEQNLQRMDAYARGMRSFKDTYNG